MSRGSKLKDMHVAVLVVVMLGVSAGCVWWMYVLPRQQARHWIKNGYPTITNHKPPNPYGNMREWEQFGHRIRGIDGILAEMYYDTEIWDHYRYKLHSGMRAAGGPQTMKLLMRLAQTPADEELADFGIGGLRGQAYYENQEARGVLFEVLHDGRYSIHIRGSVLLDFVYRQDTEAIAFALEHGEELIEETNTQNAHELTIKWLETAIAKAKEEAQLKAELLENPQKAGGADDHE